MRHHRGMYSQGHPQVVTRVQPQTTGIQHGSADVMKSNNILSTLGCVRAEMYLDSLYTSVPNRGSQW